MTKPIDGRIERRVGGSAARNAAILARLDAGATMQAIAEEFGITRQRVSQIAFRVTGQHTRGPRWPAERIAELQCLRREGLSASAIGERMGRTRGAVLSAAHRLNLPPLSNRKPPVEWSEDRIALLRRLRSQRAGPGEIARQLNTSETAVTKKARKLGMPVYQQWTDDRIAMLRLLHGQGVRAAEIAQRLGLSRSSVYGAARPLGLSFRARRAEIKAANGHAGPRS